MIERLLPRRVDNDYQGHLLALWVFVPLTLVTLARSLIHIVRFDGGAQSIATIPLDSYGASAAAAVVGIFGFWGLSQLLLGLLYLIVLFRYRALIPLMYLGLIFEYLGRATIGAWKPIETLETPPGARFNLVMIVLSLVMFFISLRRRSTVNSGETQADLQDA